MMLKLFDTEVDSPLAAVVNDIDYDYQAEQWVQDTARGTGTQTPGRWVVRWELYDGVGLRAQWQRPDGDKGLPKLVAASTYYEGEWKVGT